MKIAIVGQGRVGSTLAYTLLLRGLADELVLLNRRQKIAEGEALDLQHAEAFINHPTVIRPGGVDETAGSDIIICSSVPWNQDYTSRFDIGYDNLKLFREVIPPLAKASPDAKVLVITNPVDVMTYQWLQRWLLRPWFGILVVLYRCPFLWMVLWTCTTCVFRCRSL